MSLKFSNSITRLKFHSSYHFIRGLDVLGKWIYLLGHKPGEWIYEVGHAPGEWLCKLSNRLSSQRELWLKKQVQKARINRQPENTER